MNINFMNILEINEYIEDLARDGKSLIRSIALVKQKANCTLDNAKELVINSPTWVKDKESFEHQQSELWPVFDAISDKKEINEDGEIAYTIELNK